jgi:hypothetical protein
MTAAQNRQRWAVAQKAKARAAADPTAPLAERLAGLRRLASMLEMYPHMAETLAAVRVEISRLEAIS